MYRSRSAGPRRSGTTVVLLVVCASAGCGGRADDGTAPPDADAVARTFRMGFAPNAPRAQLELLLAVIDSMALVSDITIVQQPVPWPELLAGASMDSLVEDRGGLVDYLRFITKYEALLDGIDAVAWVMLTFTDLDIPALGLPPDRAAGLSNFAWMGILDRNLQRKPAYAEWLRIFERPR
jgi:hypothetical protein